MYIASQVPSSLFQLILKPSICCCYTLTLAPRRTVANRAMLARCAFCVASIAGGVHHSLRSTGWLLNIQCSFSYLKDIRPDRNKGLLHPDQVQSPAAIRSPRLGVQVEVVRYEICRTQIISANLTLHYIDTSIASSIDPVTKRESKSSLTTSIYGVTTSLNNSRTVISDVQRRNTP